MTAMWFGLAAIALVGAIVLLYFDRRQRQRTGHVRQVWAKSQGYTYVSVEPALAATWRRGALAKLGYLSPVDVVSGNRKGEKFVLFDLEDSATLVAVRRQIGSDIDIDLRLKTAAPPKDVDLELLGAIGDRVVFATNPDIARHAVDQRMVAFIETLPDTVHMLWSEGNWTLGMLPVGTSSREWESTIDVVLRLSGLLHVLPPVVTGSDRGTRISGGPGVMEAEGHDPGRPLPPRSADEDDISDISDISLPVDVAGEPVPEPTRRPSLAVVPDPRHRGRRPQSSGDAAEADRNSTSNRDQADNEHHPDERTRPAHDSENDRPDRPGGPFHPGFRPYQGPAPR